MLIIKGNCVILNVGFPVYFLLLMMLFILHVCISWVYFSRPSGGSLKWPFIDLVPKGRRGKLFLYRCCHNHEDTLQYQMMAARTHFCDIPFLTLIAFKVPLIRRISKKKREFSKGYQLLFRPARRVMISTKS